MIEFKEYIDTIPNFPKEGVDFKDINRLVATPKVFAEAVIQLTKPFLDLEIDIVAGIEARGFIFAPAVALALDAGFVPVRKPGKLPGEVTQQEYDLEYGTDCVEVQKGKIKRGTRILVVDDVLATGGTVLASKRLLEREGGIICGLSFLIELSFLNGRERLGNQEIFSLIKID